MKRMKICMLGMLTLSILTLGSAACSRNDDSKRGTIALDPGQEFVAEKIYENLMLIMEDSSGEFENGGYIVCSAADGEFIILSEFSYSLGDIIYEFIQGEAVNTTLAEGNQPRKAPEGSGWKNAGTFSSKLDALKLANKLAEEIPKGVNFEIHVEYNKDGTFTVWYRIL